MTLWHRIRLTIFVFRFTRRIIFMLTEAQLAQVQTLATGIATAAAAEAQADTVVDGLTTQAAALQTQLTAAQQASDAADTATQNAITALTSYVANPT
jgi:hypothetical protein